MNVSAKSKRSFSSLVSPTELRTSPVDLVDAPAQQCAFAASSSSPQDRFTPSVTPRCASTIRTRYIRIRCAAPRGGDHGAVQPAARLNRPGCPQTPAGCCPSIAHSANARACGLHLVGHDRHLGPDHRFSSVDLPAFGSPISATNPARSCVVFSSWSLLTELRPPLVPLAVLIRPWLAQLCRSAALQLSKTGA